MWHLMCHVVSLVMLETHLVLSHRDNRAGLKAIFRKALSLPETSSARRYAHCHRTSPFLQCAECSLFMQTRRLHLTCGWALLLYTKAISKGGETKVPPPGLQHLPAV